MPRGKWRQPGPSSHRTVSAMLLSVDPPPPPEGAGKPWKNFKLGAALPGSHSEKKNLFLVEVRNSLAEDENESRPVKKPW